LYPSEASKEIFVCASREEKIAAVAIKENRIFLMFSKIKLNVYFKTQAKIAYNPE
jgi:hypothetical protein